MERNHAEDIANEHAAGSAKVRDKGSRKERMAKVISDLLTTAELAAQRGDEAAQNEALEKATALQFKYAIDMANLPKGSAEQEDDKIIYRDFCSESNTPLIKVKRELIAGLCALYRANAVMGSAWKDTKKGRRLDRRAYVRVYAHESDMTFIYHMYNSLLLQMQSMMAADEKLLDVVVTNHGIGAWRVSYGYGWVRRVYARLSELKWRQEQAEAATGSGKELVLADKGALVTIHVNSLYGRLKATNYRKDDNDLRGRAAGRAAGDRADLGQTKITNDRKALEA